MFHSKLKQSARAIALVSLLGASLGVNLLSDSTQAAPAKQEKSDDPLIWTWAYVSIESRGPDNPQVIQTGVQTFDGKSNMNTFVLEKGVCKMLQQSKDKAGKVQTTSELEVTLDRETKPHRLTMHITRDHLKSQIHCIYEVKGDTLRICWYSLAQEKGVEGTEFPSGFDWDKLEKKRYPRMDVFKRVGAK